METDTRSISSSVFAYQYENGRRYHAYRAGQYLLPNDDVEQERLDITHHVFRLALDGELCVTKLSNPQRILDVGTGTGIWAIDMGDEFPSAEIIGTDLSPIQTEWVPANVEFEVDDANESWTFPLESFDFIHVRTLAGSNLDWPNFIQKCYDHLKPGAKLEISEGRANFWYQDDSVPTDSFTYRWLMEWRELSGKLQFDVFPALKGLVSGSPFQNIQTYESPVPLGTWPRSKRLKEIGHYFRYQFLEMGLEAYTLALFTRVGGWGEVEARALIAKVRDEMKTNKMHIFTYW